MNRRAKSADRKVEIIQATLSLLAETPLESLTTRQIARKLGISQPALFRHFRSREQLLLAVMAQVRTQLGGVADQVLRSSSDPIEQLRALAAGLLSHVQQYPGLPRLLFSPPEPGPLRVALRHQLSMQTTLVAELVRGGQSTGQLRADLDPAEAAVLYIGMLQGLVLRGQLADTQPSYAHEVAPMLALWLDGARGTGTQPSVAVPEPTSEPPSRLLHQLDVRPILATGVDPLEAILAELATVQPGGVLTVVAPFQPRPLLTLLGQRGHGVVPRQLTESLWSVDIVVGGMPTIEDLTELEPPEPMERALEASAALTTGQVYLARLPRFPRMLVAQLRARAIHFEVATAEDDTALLRMEVPT